jgi:hypothetical protein
MQMICCSSGVDGREQPSSFSSNGVHGMTEELTTPLPAAPTLRAAQVYAMASISLVVGLGIGYLMRGSQLAVLPPQSSVHAVTQAATAGPKPTAHRPSVDEMKQMADKQAAPLLERLKSNPRDNSLLVQVGAIYHTTHRFRKRPTTIAAHSIPIRKMLQFEPSWLRVCIAMATSKAQSRS